MTVKFPAQEVNTVVINGQRYVSQTDLAKWFAEIADNSPEAKEIFNHMIRLMATAESVK